MKKLFLLSMAVIFFACHKSEVTPAAPRYEPPMLFNWTVKGMVIDSANSYFKHNGKEFWQNGYHYELKRGDTLTFYLVGKRTASDCQLEFWQDKNEMPKKKYYRADSLNVIQGLYYVTPDHSPWVQ